MKDKITRLSKGITDIEAPAVRIIPELFCEPIYQERSSSFVLELASDNNTSVKGICFADNPRISVEPRAFAGRRVHFTITVNAAGLEAGDRVSGELILVTNGGELSVPYEFEAGENRQSGLKANFNDDADTEEAYGSSHTDIIRNPISFDVNAVRRPRESDASADAADSAYKAEGTEAADNALGHNNSLSYDIDSDDSDSYLKTDTDIYDRNEEDRHTDEAKVSSPKPTAGAEDEEEELSRLIRSGDTSDYAFRKLSDAVKRGLSINGLYESYVRAFPIDCDEKMPDAVYIYFSYETDADHGILKKLYHNILLHNERDSEHYMRYERAMSRFAISNALKRMMDDELAVIYDRMIYPDMIDVRAAEIFPDIFKCRRIEIKNGSADYLTVGYEGLNTVMRSDIISGICFVPVYFNDAELRFYSFSEEDGAQDVTDSISYDSKALFERSDIMRRCFELNPKHEMLLLSAAKEIAARGLNSDEETDVVRRTFTELHISRRLRRTLIDKLCDYGSPSLWLDDLITDEDYRGDAGRRLFAVFCEAHGSELSKAYRLIDRCGADKLDIQDVAEVVSQIIANGAAPADENGTSPYFVSLAKYVFDKGAADKTTEHFLSEEYEGSSESMYALMLILMKHRVSIANLPEKILTVKLFAGNREHIDETFDIYINKSEYTDLLIRAYLTSRCADAFLYEAEVGDIMYEALRSYTKSAAEPLDLPLIYRLALTSYYADVEKLDEEETELLRRLSDDLIAMGLVFRYTKKLRKKIHIPEDICSRYYVQFNAQGDERPKLITRILPDNTEYRVTDMQRVYKNIYIMSTVLFKGDELQYIIYNNEHDENAAAEGIISVKKYHRQRDAVFASLDTMTKALEDRDIGLLKETMLEYAERTETIKLLFDLEK